MKLRKLVPISLAGLAAGALSACGGPHLGSGFGESYRAAFTVQANRTSRPIAPFDAADVGNTMKTHRTKPGKGGAVAGPGGGPAVPLINLDAK